MSIGHIKCFQEFARASFNDEKKREEWDCDAIDCLHCKHSRRGIIRFEMCIILWKLHDPDCLLRNYFKYIDKKDIQSVGFALKCIDVVLLESFLIHLPTAHLNWHSRLRIQWSRQNFLKYSDIKKQSEFECLDEIEIGDTLLFFNEYQACIDIHRRAHERALIESPQNPNFITQNVKPVSVNALAKSLLHAFINETRNIDRLREAERLLYEEMFQADSTDDIVVYGNATLLLAQILHIQGKRAEFERLIPKRVDKVRRILGPSHQLTKQLTKSERLMNE